MIRKHQNKIRGIRGAKPRFQSAKSGNGSKRTQAEEDYLAIRNRGQLAKAQAAEIELGRKIGQLIPRKTVEIQLSFVLVALRQKILHIHLTWPRRLLGLTDLHQMQQALRELELSLLAELQDAPRVLEEGWIEKQDDEASSQESEKAKGATKSRKRSCPRRSAPSGRRKPAATT